ncbi:hypothetical protein ACEN9X_06940 [Mucilaginibacter sp. Mucisp86]|uniref:hypothetical protein n=1 Tax=Mucilaginibacter sp. Mucisp86 TaxID=3243060 RepID=UPI0039B55280
MNPKNPPKSRFRQTALGMGADTGHERNACRRMSVQPGPQVMPSFQLAAGGFQ